MRGITTERLRIVASVVLIGCAVVLMASCRVASPDYESLLGTWQLDADTQDWLPRACVVLEYDDPRSAALEIERRDDEYRVRLTDRRGSTFHGHVRDGVFDGVQLLPTTPTGRFCGRRTNVRLRLNLRDREPGALRGVWQTPDCDVCPDRHFGATREER